MQNDINQIPNLFYKEGINIKDNKVIEKKGKKKKINKNMFD